MPPRRFRHLAQLLPVQLAELHDPRLPEVVEAQLVAATGGDDHATDAVRQLTGAGDAAIHADAAGVLGAEHETPPQRVDQVVGRTSKVLLRSLKPSVSKMETIDFL